MGSSELQLKNLNTHSCGSIFFMVSQFWWIVHGEWNPLYDFNKEETVEDVGVVETNNKPQSNSPLVQFPWWFSSTS